MLLSITVGLLVVALIIVASFVFARGSRSKLNRSFAYFTFIATVWIVTNYIGANFRAHSFAQYYDHAELFIGSFVPLGLWIFTESLIEQSGKASKFLNLQKKLLIPYCVLTLLAALCTFLSQNIRVVYSSSNTNVTYGHIFVFFAAILISIILFSFANILVSLKAARGLLRQQISIMLASLTVAISIATFANLIVPLATGSNSTNLVVINGAYLGIALFIGATSYSIIRHKLFDLQLVIARTIAYTLSLGVLTSFYIVMAAVISSFMVKDYATSIKQVLINIGLMVILVSTINPLRSFFNKKTNKIFYRDAYDPQAFLEKLNKTVVDHIELEILLRNTAHVIEDNFKCEHVTFILYDSANKHPSFYGSSGALSKLHDHVMESIHDEVSKHIHKVVVYNDLGNEKESLKKLLRDNKIAIIASLDTSNHSDSVVINYLCLGEKKSGNPYSQADIQLIEIITNELVIVIQNALHFQEIQNFNVLLQERINDATHKLRRANEKLLALDETKDDFISMASHQLRTPLTSVKGYLSMILEGDAGKVSKMQHDMISQAFISSQRMVYLISDMLNVSRLKTGRFAIINSPVNLAELANEELGQLKETAAVHNLKLTFKKPKDFPTLMLVC